jgi:hypothetical protein
MRIVVVCILHSAQRDTETNQEEEHIYVCIHRDCAQQMVNYSVTYAVRIHPYAHLAIYVINSIGTGSPIQYWLNIHW